MRKSESFQGEKHSHTQIQELGIAAGVSIATQDLKNHREMLSKF